jgi:hypothetical protein
MALDRTWYDSLHNDTGTGLDGSIWTKEDVDFLMDAIDAELARLGTVNPNIAYTNVMNTFTGHQAVYGRLMVYPLVPADAPRLNFYESKAPANARVWEIQAHAQNLVCWALKDDFSGLSTPLILTRGGEVYAGTNVRATTAFYERGRDAPVGYNVPYVPTVSTDTGGPTSVVHSVCAFSKVGQTVTVQLYLVGIVQPGVAAHLRVTMPPAAGLSVSPPFTQDLVRLHVAGQEIGYAVAYPTYWEIYRLNGATFPANQVANINGVLTYWTA